MNKALRRGLIAALIVAVACALPVSASLRTAKGRTSSASKASTARRGRPRKFSRPSRAVTLTLPEDIISTLKTLDGDLSRAVVRAVEPMMPVAVRPPAELTAYGDRAIIVLASGGSIEERTGAELVPLSDGRYLVSLGDHLTVPMFELRLNDALSDPDMDSADRALFGDLAAILRDARRRGDIQLLEHSIIVLRMDGERSRSLAQTRAG